MRYVLYESNNRLILLSKEVQFLNHYIELMRIRYTDKVRIDVSFPTDTGEIQVPPCYSFRLWKMLSNMVSVISLPLLYLSVYR